MEVLSKHICIFTQSHLSRAPRVVKEANVYAKAGYKVTVYASWHDEKILATDKLLLESSINYKAGSNLINWNSFQSRFIRLKRMIARNLVKYVGIQTKYALGYDFKNYLKMLDEEHADFYIGHQEMSMCLAKELILKGKKVAFDFEDWHSKDLLPKDRVFRPIKLLEELEKYLLEYAAYSYTTSESMAKALSVFYEVKEPEVIYNSFFASQRNQIDGLYKDVKHRTIPSVFWFSQVIGRGRGLELFFDALPLVKTSFQLHLRGNITQAYKEELKLKTPKHIELYIHELVPPEELISRIAEYDLGLAFEEVKPESRNYTITNKIFHYLQSGIPILATDTAGQMEIAMKVPEAVIMVKRNSCEIASALDAILNDANRIEIGKKSSWIAGKSLFSFENQSICLLRILNENLKN